jgi:ATP-binding cassette subfamily G (WHITE) protein 2
MGSSQSSTGSHAPVEQLPRAELVSIETRDVEDATNKVPLKYRLAPSSDGDELANRERRMTFTPTSPDNSPTVLTFEHVNVTTKVHGETKTLLYDLSGNITGGFWAIMGGSGGGKTTLLSTLSLRLDPNYMNITGEFRLNGREYSRSVLKAMTAYVMQDDLLHGELTVQETLYFAANLRMSPDLSEEARLKRIDQVIELMGIDYIRYVMVGDARVKGISGGERKRVCVAMELLNCPKLLFLDEPTTGLDSTTAYSVCHALKNLAESGECTVVCTIHQPQPKIFSLFDNLILMKKGRIIYQGHAVKSLNFLESIGKPLPPHEDLADHLLNVAAIKDGDDHNEHAKLHVPVDLTMGIEKDFYSQEGAKSWVREYRILTYRAMLQYLRRYDLIFLNLLATIIMAIFIGYGVWRDCGHSQSTVNLVRPTVFFAMVNQGVVGALQTIIGFPSERAIMLRERQAGAYQVSTYYLARTTIDFVSTIISPVVFSAIVFSTVGYQPDSNLYGTFMIFCILDNWAASSLCTAVVCTCVSIERSTVVMSFLFEFCRLFGGYYTSPLQMHDYPNWKWADALSYLKYTFVGAVLPILRAIPGHDSPNSKSQKIIDQYGYDQYTVSECIGGVIALIVGFRLLGYLGLRFVKG